MFYTKDTLKNYINNGILSVGEYTYGTPKILHWKKDNKLIIGNFCSISDDVEIFLGGEHRLDWISTYPFMALNEFPESKELKIDPLKKNNDTYIGNDVWIGRGVTIMPGVKIGDGAVISARSFVYRSVKPYSVVGGNPAEFLFYRFNKQIIDHLLKIKWWNWPLSEIKKNIHILCSNDFDKIKNLDMLENKEKNKIVAFLTYCDTEDKINCLVNNIQLVRSKYSDFEIAIQANYPLPEHVQKMADLYFYEDLNVICEEKITIFWKTPSDHSNNTIVPHFNKKFINIINDYGFSVYQMIRAISKNLIEYNKVLLMNYDVILEDYHFTNINLSDLVVYYFSEDSFSLVLMSFNPLIFYNKISSKFTYTEYAEQKNLISEQIFYNYVKKSDINYELINKKIEDKINNNLSYQNIENDFFIENFICYNNGFLEIYLWMLKTKIQEIIINIDGKNYTLTNQNKGNAFETYLYINNIENIKISSINNIEVDIPLRILKNAKSEKLN